MSGTSTKQERLAAAARVLAAAEESARCPAAGASAPPPSRMPGESASSAAARLWVAGDQPADLPDPVQPDGEDEARQIVLNQLTLGPRTRKQLADKLRERDYDADVAARVLDRMSAVGLVDDAAFAETVVRTKQAGRGLSKRALAQELRWKGVDDDVVAETLGSIDDESERARAEELVARKIRAMGGLEPHVQSRRLQGMLARKGYPSSVIYAVVRDAVNGAPEHQRD
ncbi:regulatory protein RecX [Lapillicoccus sp.]|uniref:regulatory protein RecX n=1 Tax=Lapillicoccus sp. TaxID=1909287 RepID=UPI0025F5BB33|nr:regulatory protein RecX [Lapillicoccus sp.]